MDKNKFKEMYLNEQYDQQVHREFDDDWRHGGTAFEVYKVGDKCYSVCYRVSTDGEYHGIRENDFDLAEVTPVEVTSTTYKVKERIA